MRARVLPPLAVLVGLGTMFAYRISTNVVDPDLWHEMALGREIVTTGHVPQQDLFAYTPTVSPVVHHEWAAGVVAYIVAVTTGAAGIQLLKYLLALGLFVVCWRCAARRGAGFEVMSYLAPWAVLLVDQGFSPVRAQLYSFLCTACLLYWLDRDREGERRWLVGWLPLFVVWLNLHGGFVVGAGLFAVHALEQLGRRRPWRHLLWAGVTMVGLVALNPFGVAYYGFIVRAVTLSRPHILEWAPLWRGGTAYQLAAFGLALALLAYALRARRYAELPGLPGLLVTAAFAVHSARHLPIFGLAWISLVPGYLQPTGLGDLMRRTYQSLAKPLTLLWLAITVVMVSLLGVDRFWQLRVPGDEVAVLRGQLAYPVGPVDYLEQIQFRGNLMVPFDVGAYVSWRRWPAVKVALDGRYEVAYPTSAVDENYALYMAEAGWQTALETSPTDAVLVPKRLPLARALPQEPRWAKVYEDRAYALYVRPAASRPRVDRSESSLEGGFP